MTAKEVSEILNIKESTLMQQFKRTQQTLFNKGIKLEKIGRGQSATYTIDYLRAITMFDEEGVRDLNLSSMQLISWDMLVLLGVLSTPMYVFRGTEEQFLNYIGIRNTSDNREKLRETFKELSAADYFFEVPDEDVVTLSLKRKKEKEMGLSLDMIRECKRIAAQHNMRDWIPLLKTWIATQELSEDEFYKIADIENLTGMAKSTIYSCRKALEKEEKFKSKKFYVEFNRCIGLSTELNGFSN